MSANVLDEWGDFTWGFDETFFIETGIGNYVWRDPDYMGDNTIKKYNGDYAAWIREIGIPFGRSKGRHIVRDYCKGAIVV